MGDGHGIVTRIALSTLVDVTTAEPGWSFRMDTSKRKVLPLRGGPRVTLSSSTPGPACRATRGRRALRYEERLRARPPAMGRPDRGPTRIPHRRIRPVPLTDGPVRHRRHAATPAPAFPKVVGRPGGLGAGLAAHPGSGLLSGLRADALDADGRSDQSGPAGAVASRSPVGGHRCRRRGSKDCVGPDPGGHGAGGRRIGGQRVSLPSGRVAAVCVQRGRRRISGGRLAGAPGRPADAGWRARRDGGHCAADLGRTARFGGRTGPGRHPHRHHRPQRRLRDRRGHLRGGLRRRCAPARPGAERRRNSNGDCGR